MKKPLTETSQSAFPLWQMPHWYHAATLTERIALLPAETLASSGAKTTDGEQAQKKLQRWKEQAPFHTGTFFAERLAMDSLTEGRLLALLAEPIEDVQARLSQPIPPDWIVELTRAFAAPSSLSDISQLLAEAKKNSENEAYAFLQPFQPLLQQGIERLQAGVEELVQRYHTLPFNPQTILSLLFPSLVRQLSPRVSRTLVLELNIARLRGHLHGETAQERFQSYLKLLSRREDLLLFLEEYCVLTRQILVAVDLWVDCSLEFLQRLCADWETIVARFTPGGNPGVLVEAVGGAGDTHRGGHSVILLKFHSGFQLVYKPKSLTIDVHFQELLNWLNGRGSHPAFRTIKVIDRRTYGWTEYVSAAECTSVEEVRRFYERQGGYLALLYALEASDFHAENVLASGEHPVLIDLEALFHPRIGQNNVLSSERPAFKAVEHSVLRSALLPQRFWVNNEFESVDMSGLGSAKGQLSPLPLPKWEGMGTDEMRLVRERKLLGASNNRPQLEGQEVQALDYLDRIVTGFTIIYRLLMEHRDEFLTECLPRFTHDEIRFVARNTRSYVLLLTESFHPNLLRDGLKRERFLDSLWMEIAQRPYLRRLVAAERADLLQGDIPMFTTRVDSCNLFTSQGECIQDFFDHSSLELVKQRLQHLDEEDLRRQVWMIRASFTSVSPATSAPRPLLPGEQQSTDACHKRLLEVARAVGDRLCALALLHEDTADWFGLTLAKEREWIIAPAGLDLYSGLPGIIFFLAYLGAVTRDSRYTTLAQSACKTLSGEIAEQTKHPDQLGIGAFTGLGSPIYLFSHLAPLWNTPALLREAEDLVRLLPALVEKDKAFDLVDGAAGTIASLLSLSAMNPHSQVLDVAIQCGDHLLACAQHMSQGCGWRTPHQEMPLTGFSRGAAGIAWSLLYLADVSGEKRFREMALAALAYERHQYAPERRNWPDLREDPALKQHNQAKTIQEAQYSMSWSHGAPGIALGRLASLPYLDDTTIRQEIEIALDTTIKQGPGYDHKPVGPNHSLYWGDAGNLEVLLTATQVLDAAEYRKCLKAATARFVRSINANGPRMGTPESVETPGFMLGLAGIGYELLRLAEPARVPSLLTLAPYQQK